jgi:hypothetical protein
MNYVLRETLNFSRFTSLIHRGIRLPFEPVGQSCSILFNPVQWGTKQEFDVNDP